MIYVHTYEVIILGQKEYIQFYEYQKGHLFVCESQDIPYLVIVNTLRHPLRQAMFNSIYHSIYERYKSYPRRVVKVSEISFDTDSFDMSG